MWRVLEKANVYKVFMGKSEEKSLIEELKHVWANIIKKDHLNMMEDVDWIDLAQENLRPLVKAVLNLWNP
jgi:hypothetical protein